MHLGHIKSPENASSGRKCCLVVPVSALNLAEPLMSVAEPKLGSVELRLKNTSNMLIGHNVFICSIF